MKMVGGRGMVWMSIGGAFAVGFRGREGEVLDWWWGTGGRRRRNVFVWYSFTYIYSCTGMNIFPEDSHVSF